MNLDSLRNKISRGHAIFGDGYRMLDDDDIVRYGDQTGCLSTLLSITAHEGWREVVDDEVGRSVYYLCEEDGDLDGDERVFRRKL